MKKDIPFSSGMSTLVNQYSEGDNALGAHVTPIYQTSTFGYPDVETMQAIWSGKQPGYMYSRSANPNVTQVGDKYAMLEGLDLLRAKPEAKASEVVVGKALSSGMAAIASAVLGRVHAGGTVITQKDQYGNAFSFWHDLAPRLGLKVIWTKNNTLEGWAEAFAAHPEASVAYTETPANPTMSIIDLKGLADLAHANDAWVIVDNTFATPYHQRPLSLGCDVVIHSTTKFLSGHGQIIGGAIISHHLDYMNKDVKMTSKLLGQAPSPFDTWLANIGLKTFEIRMERHATNGMAMAEFLQGHAQVERVYYPGLANHEVHDIAVKQMMNGFGSMITFELKGGYEAGVKLLESVQIPTFAVSLGNVDTLIEHPAGMTHLVVPPEERLAAGITDGMIRISVGIENIEDLLSDMDRALSQTGV